MALVDDPIDAVDPATPGYAFRDTDKILVTLTDAAGASSGQSVLTDVSALRTLFAAPPVFSATSPVSNTPPAGVTGQLYYHRRTTTLTDVYQYTGGVWAVQLVGLSTNNAARLVISFPAGGTNTITIPIGAEQAGNYTLPTTAPGLTALTYAKGTSSVTGTATLAAGDLLGITGTTQAGIPGTLTLLAQ